MFLLFSWILGFRGVPEKKVPDVQEFPEFLGMSRNSPTLAVFLENGEFLHFFRKTQEVGVFLKKVLRNRKKCPETKKVLRRQKKCSGTKKVLRNKKKWFRTTFSLFRHLGIPDHRKSEKVDSGGFRSDFLKIRGRSWVDAG